MTATRVIGGTVVLALLLLSPAATLADGVMLPPADYEGSLEETAQEAIIIFQGGGEGREAVEDLILKATVAGDAESFGWVIPFPTAPEIAQEDAVLFKELFDYVELRNRHGDSKGGDAKQAALTAAAAPKGVEVISRKAVGSYDTAVVREDEAGALNRWLKEEGFKTLEAHEDLVSFYRDKSYVFACVKVRDAVRTGDDPIDLHPLRFTFKTGGIDGIFFPMKMTGAQREPFDVNLYVFYKAWVNDRLSRYGFTHRGFELVYRDWDSRDCEPNAGKSWSAPSDDPLLASADYLIPNVAKLFQKLYPGELYYLTNLQAKGLKPADVLAWSDDLWLFPYYTDTSMIPHDAREGGPAHLAWANVAPPEESAGDSAATAGPGTILGLVVGLLALAIAVAFLVLFLRRKG